MRIYPEATKKRVTCNDGYREGRSEGIYAGEDGQGGGKRGWAMAAATGAALF
jgi:hypothetical protein